MGPEDAEKVVEGGGGDPRDPVVDREDSCSQCDNPLDAWVDRCRHCQHAADFPNVRAARRSSEVAALNERYEAVTQNADSKMREVIRDFEFKVAISSKAVINRSIQALEGMLRSEDDISNQFYRQIDAGLRLPESDRWNKVRVIADDVVFPGFKKHIRYAALSLSDTGLTNYGECTVVLQSSMIEKRASVLDQNSLIWCNDHVLKDDIFDLITLPPGHRAAWTDRARLAVAKLGAKLNSDEAADEATLLIGGGTSTADDDFIEVHIWGSITSQSIESVTLPGKVDRKTAPYLQIVQENLASANILYRTVAI